jgi:peptide/nickel transport system ATP-binding protein
MAGSGKAHMRPAGTALLTIEDLVVEFPVGRTGLKVNAVSGISLDVMEGETVGLVGESGCGKSTTGKAIMQLPAPTSGSINLEGVELTKLSREAMRRMRPRMQMIFQDPISSLNPRRKIVDIVAEPLKVWGNLDKDGKPAKTPMMDRVRKVLDTVGIDIDQAGTRKPHEFSGGQCQRICIARSVVMEPKVIICDEPVSALDVSVQAQILNLLEDMKREYGLTMIFIAHDLAVVKNISDRVVVMYLGKICEVGGPDALYSFPAHHYTRALIDSIPEPDPTQRPDDSSALEGDLPSPIAPPSGCRFRTRCPAASDICATEEPQLKQVAEGHFVACHFPLAKPEHAPHHVAEQASARVG